MMVTLSVTTMMMVTLIVTTMMMVTIKLVSLSLSWGTGLHLS